MNLRSTGILAIVAAALGAFVYFYEIEGQLDRDALEEADRRVFADLDAESIDVIALESQDGIPARFHRVDGDWELVEPVEAPADAAALEAMASVLSQLARVGPVEDPGPLHEYGLGEEARTIHFDVGEQAHGLRIGRGTPVGGHLYVATLSSDDVAYVDTFRLNVFNRNLSDLRNRRVMSFEPADVSKISLVWPGAAVELTKSDGRWQMLAPVDEPADQPTVRDLLTNLSFLNAQGFVDEEDGATAAAMARVEMSIRLTVNGAEHRLEIGGTLDGVPLVRGQSDRLFTIASERFEEFERRVPAYRFRTLSEFDASEAREVLLDFAAETGGETNAQEPTSTPPTIEARLAGARWRSDEPEIDPARFDSLIQTLSRLEAVTIVADEMGTAERASLGLSPPRSRLRVRGQDEDQLADISFGRVDPERGIYAQRAADSKIYLLDAALTESLPVSQKVFDANFAAPLLASGEDASSEDEGVGEDEGTGPEFTDDAPLSDLEFP